MTNVLAALILAILGITLYSRYETQITGFFNTSSHDTMMIFGVLGALILTEALKSKPKKKKE